MRRRLSPIALPTRNLEDVVAGAEAVMADLRSLDAANAVTSRLAASVVRPLRAPTERGLAGATPPKRRARSVAARAGIDPAQESSNDPEFRSAFSSYIELGFPT
jgi:hypothetical protein